MESDWFICFGSTQKQPLKFLQIPFRRSICAKVIPKKPIKNVEGSWRLASRRKKEALVNNDNCYHHHHLSFDCRFSFFFSFQLIILFYWTRSKYPNLDLAFYLYRVLSYFFICHWIFWFCIKWSKNELFSLDWLQLSLN